MSIMRIHGIYIGKGMAFGIRPPCFLLVDAGGFMSDVFMTEDMPVLSRRVSHRGYNANMSYHANEVFLPIR